MVWDYLGEVIKNSRLAYDLPARDVDAEYVQNAVDVFSSVEDAGTIDSYSTNLYEKALDRGLDLEEAAYNIGLAAYVLQEDFNKDEALTRINRNILNSPHLSASERISELLPGGSKTFELLERGWLDHDEVDLENSMESSPV